MAHKTFSEKNKKQNQFEAAQWELLKALRDIKHASAAMSFRKINVYDVIEDSLHKVFNCNISLI